MARFELSRLGSGSGVAMHKLDTFKDNHRQDLIGIFQLARNYQVYVPLDMASEYGDMLEQAGYYDTSVPQQQPPAPSYGKYYEMEAMGEPDMSKGSSLVDCYGEYYYQNSGNSGSSWSEYGYWYESADMESKNSV